MSENLNQNYNKINSNETMETIDKDLSECIDNNLPQFSSKNSVYSNSSEDKHSIKSKKSDKSSNKYEIENTKQYPKDSKDMYCWDCHKSTIDFSCQACPRSYHQKCSLKKLTIHSSDDNKLCPECIDIMRAEEGTNPSGCMQWLNGNVNQLSKLLKYTIVTVKAADKNNSFSKPLSDIDFEYQNLIVNPMDLSLIEKNVKNKTYASTNSFLADVKWINHNCIVLYSGINNAFLSEAKNILRVAKQECEEIEICPDCYYNYYSLEEDNYFSATCRKPHAIVWAKLKGHPYWPAKVVRYNTTKQEVDVRFFGTHDKCWLKPDKCYLMSQNYPSQKKPSKFDQNKFDEAIRDMNSHLDELEKRHKGVFKFYEKYTFFTIDKLYLTPNASDSHFCDNKNKKVLLTYNGIEFKTLKVNASKFDIRNHLNEDIEPSDQKVSPNKRLKKSPIKGPKAKTNRCFSKAIGIRQELSSSVDSNMESERSSNEDKLDSEAESCFSSNIHQNSRKSNENNLVNNCFDKNDSKCSELLNKSKMFTISGKSSEIFNINKSNVDSNHKSNTGFDKKVVKKSDSSPQKRKLKLNIDKSTDTSNNESIEESLRTKIKSLEFKIRKLEEEKNESIMSSNAFEEEKQELQKSINDIKRKQWCTNCLKEAILPCCWNTCYCTVECQHKHWPIHSKSCRRRQQQTTTKP